MAVIASDAVPVLQPALDTGIPSAGEVNELAKASPKSQTVAAEDTPLPITWGRDRIYGKVGAVAVQSDILYVMYTFGEGPIEGYETIYVDGVDVNASGGFLSVSGAQVEEHTGTATQAASTLLSGAITGYTDTLTGVAYVVLKIPEGATSGFPRVEAIIKGQKVYDARRSALGGGDILRLALGTTIPAALETNSVSAEAWVRIRSGWKATNSVIDIIDNMDRVNEGWLLGVTTAGQLTFRIYTNTSGGGHQTLTTSMTTALTDGDVFHVACTYSHTEKVMRIYLNGKQVGTKSLTSQSYTTWNVHWDTATNTDLEFGTGGNADMQEVRIWSDKRTQAELEGNMLNRLSGTEAGLVGYWPIYENTGTSIEDHAGTFNMTRNSSASFLGAFKGLSPSNTSPLSYTTNPTICFSDFIERFTVREMDYDSVLRGAGANDELVGGSPRREVGWTVNSPKTVDSWVQAWRVYMGAFIAWEKGKMRVIPAAPEVNEQGSLELNGSSTTYAYRSDSTGIGSAIITRGSWSASRVAVTPSTVNLNTVSTGLTYVGSSSTNKPSNMHDGICYTFASGVQIASSGHGNLHRWIRYSKTGNWSTTIPAQYLITDANQTYVAGAAYLIRFGGSNMPTPITQGQGSSSWAIMHWETATEQRISQCYYNCGYWKRSYSSVKNTRFTIADTGSATIEAWFRLGATGVTGTVFAKRNTLANTAAGYSLHVNTSNYAVAGVSDGTNHATITDSVNLNDGKWHYAAMTINRSTDKLELTVDDRDLTAQSISSVGALRNTKDIRVGATGDGNNRFTGSVDDLRFWSDVRTATERGLYMAKEVDSPATQANLLAYWKFNDQVGQTAKGSANSYDMTLNGDASFGEDHSNLLPEGIHGSLMEDDILKGTLKLSKKPKADRPTVVHVSYRDKSLGDWGVARQEAEAVGVSTGTVPRRLSKVDMPGMHSAQQAKREAIERLNWYSLSELEAEFTTFDEGLELQQGSIIALTHPIGLERQLFRVIQLAGRMGRWVVRASSHDPSIYSDDVVSDPSYNALSLGNPLSPPAITGLSAAEELFNYRSGLTGSRVRASWTNTYPYTTNVLVEGYVGSTRVWQALVSPGVSEAVSPPVEELVSDVAVTYEVRVSIQTQVASGPVTSTTATVSGKTAVPSDVSNITFSRITANAVEASWDAATDIDVWRYDLRQGSSSHNHGTATRIDLCDGLSHVVTDLAEGTTRLFVKAVDTVGNLSTNSATVDVTAARPATPTGFSVTEVAGQVRARWTLNPPTDFVERYKLTATPVGGSSEETVGEVQGDRLTSNDVREGNYTFKLYAVNSVGESATPASAVREVSSDFGAFLVDEVEFTSPTLTNMHEYQFRDHLATGEKIYVTASDSTDAFDTGGPPHDFSRETSHLANFHASVNGTYLSETKDFGTLITGNWNAEYGYEVLDGSANRFLELSADNTNFTTFVGTSGHGEYRYARIRITTMGDSTVKLVAPITVGIITIPREEYGSGTSSATTYARQILEDEYSFFRNIQIVPTNTNLPLVPTVDNIIVGPKTGVKGDGSSYLDAGDESAFDFGASDNFTVECWVKHSGGTGNNKVVVGKRDSSAGWLLRIDEGTNAIDIVLDSNTTTTTTIASAVPNDGVAHHIAFSVDRGADELRVYVDGTADSNNPVDISGHTGSFANTAGLRVFADNSGSNDWSGTITELRIWDSVRTATEISDNKNIEVDVDSTDLEGYWRFHGRSGSAVTSVKDEVDFPDAGQNFTATGTGLKYAVLTGTTNKRSTFDVRIYNLSGTQVSQTFTWSAQVL